MCWKHYTQTSGWWIFCWHHFLRLYILVKLLGWPTLIRFVYPSPITLQMVKAILTRSTRWGRVHTPEARSSLAAEFHHTALGKHQEKCQLSWSSSQGCASWPGIWGEQDFLSLLLPTQVQHTVCFTAKETSTLAPTTPLKLHFKAKTKDWRSNCRRADTHNCEQILNCSMYMEYFWVSDRRRHQTLNLFKSPDASNNATDYIKRSF